MKSVFIVTSRGHLGYWVERVFSSKRKADEWIERAVHPDHRQEYCVEEHTYDPTLEYSIDELTAYRAYFTSDGELLLEVEHGYPCRYTADEPWDFSCMVRPLEVGGHVYKYRILPIMAPDKTEAKKLAYKIYKEQIEGKNK